MWSRQELKSNARIMLKANYLKIVIVSVVFALLTSSGYQSARGAAKGSDADINLSHLTGIQWSLVMAAFAGIVGVVIIAFLVNVLIAVFVWNPLSVGCIKYFIDCRYGNAELKDILFVFRNNYVNVCVNIFLKQLFTFLWCLLLIVPGIVKAYEYMMVPYLLAENPDMSREEVFAMSKRMMDGNKWSLFCLNFSFIGWMILSACTFGIGDLFLNPYTHMATAHFYLNLSRGSSGNFNSDGMM